MLHAFSIFLQELNCTFKGRNVLNLLTMLLQNSWLKQNIVDWQTDESSEDHSKHRFDAFRGDQSSIYSPQNLLYYAKRRWSSA